MRVVTNENVIFFDVDDTLVLWDEKLMPPEANQKQVEVLCPHRHVPITLVVNVNNCILLQEKYARGHTTVVWSQGGYQWAEAVIKALELEEYVNLIMSKPSCYVDDLPIESWLRNRINIPATANYKGWANEINRQI